MNDNFKLIHLIIAFAGGILITLAIGYYFVKNWIQKQMQDVQKLFKKEELRQMSNALGRNLSERDINMMMQKMEQAMSKAKSEKDKK